MASILTDTKHVLGLDAAYTQFDPDVTMYINAAFSTLSQLGVGPDEGFFIVDGTEEWTAFDVPANQLHLTKTYIYLKVRMLFDPPGTSFLIDAMQNQIAQMEWRLNMLREVALPDPEEVAP